MTEKQFFDWQTSGGTARLVESYPHLWRDLSEDVKEQLQPPADSK